MAYRTANIIAVDFIIFLYYEEKNVDVTRRGREPERLQREREAFALCWLGGRRAC